VLSYECTTNQLKFTTLAVPTSSRVAGATAAARKRECDVIKMKTNASFKNINTTFDKSVLATFIRGLQDVPR